VTPLTAKVIVAVAAIGGATALGVSGAWVGCGCLIVLAFIVALGGMI
jgi:hypothetical protein